MTCHYNPPHNQMWDLDEDLEVEDITEPVFMGSRMQHKLLLT